MPSYRIFFMTDDGHIDHASELECESDAEAIRAAETARGNDAIELWSLARVVKKWPGRAVAFAFAFAFAFGEAGDSHETQSQGSSTS